MKHSNSGKIGLGIIISLIFLYLALRKVDFEKFVQAFAQIHLIHVAAALLLILITYILRAWRWRYLMLPIGNVSLRLLFNSLVIGYMFNVFLPAHLGEFVRAYVVGRKSLVPASSAFGTIVIERILDVFSLLVLMALSLIVFPFPAWVKISGYISFLFIALLLLILILMKKYRETTLSVLNRIFKPLPLRIREKIEGMLHAFLDGVVPLRHWSHYLIVLILTVVMWVFYGLIFELILWSFNFVAIYELPWYTSLVLIVITTISVVVPSSPGYVGTYHYLCQLSLGMFGVPGSPALSYAVVVHGINILPVLILGLIILPIEGLTVKKLQANVE